MNLDVEGKRQLLYAHLARALERPSEDIIIDALGYDSEKEDIIEWRGIIQNVIKELREVAGEQQTML